MNHAIFLLYPDWGTLLHLHFYVNIKFTTPEASGGFVSDLTLICFSKKATGTQDAVFWFSLYRVSATFARRTLKEFLT